VLNEEYSTKSTVSARVVSDMLLERSGKFASVKKFRKDPRERRVRTRSKDKQIHTARYFLVV
jgi:hypothetical protein